MKRHTKNIILFVLFAYLFGWLIQIIPLMLGAPVGVYRVGQTLTMWTPALAFFLTRTLSKKEAHLYASLRPKIEGHIPHYLLAWFGAGVFALAGTALYYLVFRNELDLTFSYINDLTQQAGAAADLPVPPVVIVAVQFVSAFTFGNAVNMFFALGEEIGWRGFLYPALYAAFGGKEARKRAAWKAHLITALIWSFWHFPINTLTGYNYGTAYPGFPVTGAVAMFVMCFAVGVIQSVLVEKTGSIWPAAILHGAFNALAGWGLMLQHPDYMNGAHTILGPGLNGMLAGLPMLVVALFLLKKSVFAKTAQL